MIRIVKSERDFAQNGATGITIHTGTRYFAAVLLQEYYEFWRYVFWFWLVPPVVGVVAGYILGWPYALIGLAVMMLVGQKILPLNLHERELMGQAIEIAAIKLFYGRSDMAGEYRLQARSLIRSDSPYKAKGYWPDIPAINPMLYTNEMAIAGISEPSIDEMLVRLGEKAPEAEKYVKRHWSMLEKWRYFGAEDKGY